MAKIAKEMLSRWNSIRKALEDEAEEMDEGGFRIPWSDVVVLDAYLSDQWDTNVMGDHPDTEDAGEAQESSDELAQHWPSLDDIPDGVDIFEATHGPATGQE